MEWDDEFEYLAEPDEPASKKGSRFIALVLTLCKYYHWEPSFWRRMGRREFYLIVDETHRRITESEQRSTGSWDGYENNAAYQAARKRTGRAPLKGA